MMFLSLAFVFAGVNKAYAQPDAAVALDYINVADDVIQCVTPTEITASCVLAPGPLNPQAGFQYEYSVEVTPAGDHTIHWFVTTEPNIIAAYNDLTNSVSPVGGDYIIAAGTTGYATYDLASNTNSTIDITWKSFVEPENGAVLLVTYVVDEDGCTDNIEVYRIRPVHRFTLDIAALNSAGAVDENAEDCYSPIRSAIYNPTGGTDGDGLLTVDYGENYIFYVVNAANFAHSWMPSFQLTYGGASEAIEVDWTYLADANDAAATWNPMSLSGDTYTGTTPVNAPSNGEVGEDGDCIVVRVLIDHGTVEEGIVEQDVILAVDGIMYDSGAETADDYYTNPELGDIHHAEVTGEDCPWIDGFVNDVATFTLTPRPDITSTTEDDDNNVQPFEDKTPQP